LAIGKRHPHKVLLQQVDRHGKKDYILHQERHFTGHRRKASSRIPTIRHERDDRDGRKKCLEAAEQVGEVKVVEKTDKNGRVCRTTYEWNGKDALVGYLRFLAVYHPPTFGGLLGRVMPLQANVKTDTQVNVSYPTLEEAHQALREHGFDPEVIEAARRPKFLERKDE